MGAAVVMAIVGALTAATVLAQAQAPAVNVTIREAWVRGTVGGQRASGAFMFLKSAEDAALVGAASTAAKVVEVHEMRIDDQQIMRMRQVDRVALPKQNTIGSPSVNPPSLTSWMMSGIPESSSNR